MLIDRSAVLRALERRDEALADLTEARGLAVLFEDETILASIESALAEVAFEAGSVLEARRHAEEALTLAQRSGSTYRETSLLCLLAGIALAADDTAAVQSFAQQALSAAHGREPHIALRAIQYLAAVAALHGKLDRAARLLGYVERSQQSETLAVRESTAQHGYEILVGALRRLPEKERDAFIEQGANLQDEVAVSEAMQA
jgi:ATP/maltotriose-dependent transcriptional regulator MalT